MVVCSLSWAQAPRTDLQFGDDTWVQVPLQFPFPLYGATFTNSFMFSNGVVGFFGINQNPMTSFCCSGENLSSNSWTGFNYSIMPLWTDLYPVQSSSFYIEGDSTYQKYQWNNIAEISNMNNLNTFGVTIHPSGLINYNYDNINIQNQFVTSAVTGNLANGEFMQFYHGIGMNNNSIPSLNFSVTPQYNDPCLANPLHSPSCPGYQQAYHDQQCSINPLYAVSCPGYQQAYYTQQCSANPLYDSGCPGYQQAYFDQQCSLDPLYNESCLGYQQAYFDQQCSANPLYNESCAGYQVAYYSLQCSLNTLYDSGCPGYAQAYFDQQCSLNGLYDRTCPNYAQAYATQQLLNQQNSPTTIVTTTSEPVVEISDDGKVSTDVPLVSDPVVNQVLTKKPETKKEESKEEKKDVAVAEKPKAKSTRQAAPAKVDPATQTQSEKEFEQTVASQAAAVNAISFVPGFSAYQNAIIPDTNALTMQRQYNKPTVDNARAQRQLSGASDRLHQQMVDEQYR